MSESSQNKITQLQNKIKNQEQIITIIKEFFSSHTKFIKLYRKNSTQFYSDMEKLLDEQEIIFKKLDSIINS